MPTFIVRLWLPDRPGALGSVASRIGAVRGDVVAVDILERGASWAVDELHVELPDDKLLDLLVSEVNQVDGVRVEGVRPADTDPLDPAVAAFEAAVCIHAAATIEELAPQLANWAARLTRAHWSAVVQAGPGEEVSVEASVGDGVPPGPWLMSAVGGAAPTLEEVGVGDLAWAHVGEKGPVIVVGRRLPFRARERRHLEGLARLAAERHRALDGRC